MKMKSSSELTYAYIALAVLVLGYSSLITYSHCQHLNNANSKQTNSNPTNYTAEYQQASTNDSSNEPDPTSNCNFLVNAAFWNVSSTVVTALATVLMAVFTVILTGIARSANETTKKDLRAYLTVEHERGSSVGYTKNSNGEWEFRCSIQIINKGNTPATNVRIHKTIAEIPVNLTPRDDFFSKEEGKRIVDIPKGGVEPEYISEKLMKGTGDSVTIPGILDDKIGVIFFGLVEYVDAFDTPQLTQFCFSVWPPFRDDMPFLLKKRSFFSKST